MESIALVSPSDGITGYAPKLLVHQQGLLHRAFSVVIFNNASEILMQKRATSKYHSGGLWTNTCCSHLVEGKDMETYMHERLQHEMGFDCELKFAFSFHYTAKFDNGLTENEIDHVYTGKWNGTPLPDPNEADDYRWATMDDIKSEIERNPDSFTYWFKEIIFRLSTFSSAKAKSLNF
ncbi:MAG: isopentenyl-diphosphate Delta-isomerase [Bacteroidales bacterium]|nr:isopentenyl-diphosphate Delta-isomerase [Bacteroidales bacterium]